MGKADPPIQFFDRAQIHTPDFFKVRKIIPQLKDIVVAAHKPFLAFQARHDGRNPAAINHKITQNDHAVMFSDHGVPALDHVFIHRLNIRERTNKLPVITLEGDDIPMPEMRIAYEKSLSHNGKS